MAATGSGRRRSTRLVLLRHGPAEEEDPQRWPDDTLRPLAEDGRAELKRALRGLSGLLPPIDHLASSSAVRAWETAELLRKVGGTPARVEAWPELLPGAPAGPILHRVSEVARPEETVVVVGHAPTLAELLGLCILGEEVVLAHVARGGAAGLEFGSSVRPGAATLQWLLTRKQLSGAGA